MTQNHDYSALDFDQGVVENELQQITDNFLALMTAHRGPTAPSGVQRGASWLDTDADPWELKKLNENNNWVSILELTSAGRDLIQAAGSRDTLGERIDAEHNADGTHKTSISANISEWIDYSPTNPTIVDADSFQVDGEETELFEPNGTAGRMVRIDQPNQQVFGPVASTSYDSNNDVTTVNLGSERNQDINTGSSIDDIDYGTVAGSLINALPKVIADKIFTGDGTESDSSLRLGAFSLPVDDSPLDFPATHVQTAIQRLDGFRNYLSPSGLVIANNSTNPNTDIDVSVGGKLWVHDPADESTGIVVDAPLASPAVQLDTSGVGGRLNSTLDTEQWYEPGIIAMADGTVDYVAWKPANRPTQSSDLPSGYDYYRAMGTPGKTWWVKTDGSSNILGFSHNSDGWMVWDSTSMGTFAMLYNATSPSSQDDTFDISAQAPPTKQFIHINNFRVDSNSNGAVLAGFHNESMPDARSSQTYNNVTGANLSETSEADLKNIESQTVHVRISDLNSVSNIIAEKVSQFKAVQ